MICENAVSWPWPCALVPTRAVTVPSSSISTAPYSWLNTIGALISRYADTPMPSSFVSPRSRSRLLFGPQLVVARVLERGVERHRVFAGVVRRAQAGVRHVRERVGRDEVLAPDLDRVDAELVGRDVERCARRGGSPRDGRRRDTRRSGVVFVITA